MTMPTRLSLRREHLALQLGPARARMPWAEELRPLFEAATPAMHAWGQGWDASGLRARGHRMGWGMPCPSPAALAAAGTTPGCSERDTSRAAGAVATRGCS